MKQRLHKEQWSFTFMIRSHQSLVYIVYVQVKESLLGLFVKKKDSNKDWDQVLYVCVVCSHAHRNSTDYNTPSDIFETSTFSSHLRRPSLFPCVGVSLHKMWQQDLKTCQGLKWYLRGYNYTKGANSIYPVLWRDRHWGPHNGWCCFA